MKRNRRVVILHQKIHADSSLDDRDVLEQVDAVSQALIELGYTVFPRAFDLNMQQMARDIREADPLFIFNLTESVDGDDRLVYLVPSLLEHLRIQYTGCDSQAIFLTTNKVLAKEWMKVFNIPTPEWLDSSGKGPLMRQKDDSLCIVKGNFQHASAWFTDDAIFTPRDMHSLKRIVSDRTRQRGVELFAERFIQGREFNVSVLGGKVLPIPEMCFIRYPKDKPRVVDYRGKWEEGSFEYQNTRRKFCFASRDRSILKELERISKECWRRFRLSGYARVDFRVDREGNPWVLEINANPSLSPDAGLFAAAKRSGYSYPQLIQRIIKERHTFPSL